MFNGKTSFPWESYWHFPQPTWRSYPQRTLTQNGLNNVDEFTQGCAICSTPRHFLFGSRVIVTIVNCAFLWFSTVHKWNLRKPDDVIVNARVHLAFAIDLCCYTNVFLVAWFIIEKVDGDDECRWDWVVLITWYWISFDSRLYMNGMSVNPLSL